MRCNHKYKVISVRLTGEYHKQKGQGCQDFCISRQNCNKIVMVASDGAGSAKYGAVGAKYVCEIVSRTLISASFKEIRQSVIDAVEYTRDTLVCHRLNKQKNAAGLIDFASTLVGAFYDGKKGLFFHIGDGAGIALNENGGRRYVISEPENGIFSSETFFFTMDDWKDSLRFTPFEKADNLFLMTDGVTGFALKRDMHSIEKGFIDPVNQFLRNEKNIKRAQTALKNTLNTPKARQLNSDDKTLIWADLR